MKKFITALFFLSIAFFLQAQQSPEDLERGLKIMEQRGEIRREGNKIIFLNQRPADTAFSREIYTKMLANIDPSKIPYTIAFEIDPKYAKKPILKNNSTVKKPVDTTRPYVYVPAPVRANTNLREYLFLKNGDFETGVHRLLPGWKIDGRAFMQSRGTATYTWNDFDIVSNTDVGGDYWRDIKFHTGYKHDKWITSKGDGIQGSSTDRGRATGTLTSDAFKLYPNQNFISFLIAGGNYPDQLKVELVEVVVATRLTGNVNGIQNTPAPIPGISRNNNIGTAIDTLYRAIAGIESKTGHNNFIFRREWWDVHQLDTAKLYAIRITDNSTNLEWGIINADDFRMVQFNPIINREADDSLKVQRIHIPDMVSKEDQVITADVYVPIYGATDLHTHLMSHLAMGHKLIYGAPDIGSIVPAGTYFCNPENYRAETVEQCLGNCNSSHGGWGLTDNGCGNYLRAAILNFAFDGDYEHRVPLESNLHGDHPHAGYPDFIHWPHFSSASHQQMYADWIKRAYQGGLRVLVTLTVNSELLGAILSGDGPFDDKTVADLQLDEIKLFVERHSDFMQLARTPAEMRSIIRSNKMAVVLGMEVDNIGNFNYTNLRVDEGVVKAEVQRLYDKGVRYIFPIHLVNNKFGGSAVYSILFNLSNKYTNSRPLPWGAPIPPGLMFNMEPARDTRIKYTLNLTGDVPSAGGMNAAIVGIGALFDGISEISYPPAFNVDPTSPDFCPVPKLGCIQQFRIIKSLLTIDPAWDIYNGTRGGQQNQLGLTPLGEVAIKEMMRLGMIIDVDHMSDNSVTAALSLANRFQYPVVSGHNGMRDGFFESADHKVSENQRSNEQLTNIRTLGGVFGLGIAESTAAQYLANFRIAMNANKMNGGGIMMGSDINGFVTMPKPRHGDRRGAEKSRYTGSIFNNWGTQVRYAAAGAATYSTATGYRLRKYHFGNKDWDYNTDGVAHIGLYPDYFQDLKNLGMTQTERQVFFSAADYFVNMWDKCLKSKVNVQ